MAETIVKNRLYYERLSKSTNKRSKLHLSFDFHFYQLIFDPGWFKRFLNNRSKFKASFPSNFSFFLPFIKELGFLKGSFSWLINAIHIQGIMKFIEHNSIKQVFFDYENQLIDHFFVYNLKSKTDCELIGMQRFIINRSLTPKITYNAIINSKYKPDKVLIAGKNYSKCFAKGNSFFETLDFPVKKVVPNKTNDGKTMYVVLGSDMSNFPLIINFLSKFNHANMRIELLLHPLNSINKVKKSFTHFNYRIKKDRDNFNENSIIVSSPTTFLLKLDGIADTIYMISNVNFEDKCFESEFNHTKIKYIYK